MPGPDGGPAGPERDPPVMAGRHGARQAGVDHLAHGRVGERVPRALLPHQQVAQPRERLPRGGRLAVQQRGERLRGDRLTEDRGGAEDPAVALVQPAEAGRGDATHARGQWRLAALRPAVGGDRSGVLRGVARVAAAQRGEAAGQAPRQAGPVEQVPQQPAGVGRAERLQHHSRCLPRARPVGRHDRQWQRAEPLRELRRERPGRRANEP